MNIDVLALLVAGIMFWDVRSALPSFIWVDIFSTMISHEWLDSPVQG